MIEELFAGAILSILSSWITHLVNIRKTRKEIKKIRKAYNLPAVIPFSDYRNTILLVGIGGVGKTSLINRLLECKTANPNEQTASFKIYWQRVCNSDEAKPSSNNLHHQENSPGFWYYICDYCGQNIGSLFRAFIEQQKREYSPIAYGYINSLVLMVDLFPPPPEKDQKLKSGIYKAKAERIITHKNEWNNTAIDAVFGLLTQELKYVCLFINKIDLMEKRSEEAVKVYESAFATIINAIKIRQKQNYFKFDIIVGSAYCGTGVYELKEQLRKYSVSSVHTER